MNDYETEREGGCTSCLYGDEDSCCAIRLAKYNETPHGVPDGWRCSDWTPNEEWTHTSVNARSDGSDNANYEKEE